MLSATLDYTPKHATLLEPWIERVRAGDGGPESNGVLVFVGEDGVEETITAERLLTEVLARRRGLEALRLRQGDVAVIALGHSFELIASFLACIHGGIAPTIASAYVGAAQPIDAHVKRVKLLSDIAAAAAVIAAPGHAAALRKVGCRVVDTEEIGAGVGAAASELPLPVLNDIAFIQYTSGTGGRPKAIAHRHDTLLRYIESKRRAQPIGSDEVIVSWLPLYHDLGLMSGLLTPLVLGVKTVLLSPFHWVRSPGILLRAIHTHHGTLCFLPNFALNHCALAIRERELDGIDLSSWRALVCGAELVRADSIEMFTTRFAACGFRPEAMRAGYGMAETVEGSTVTPPGRPPRVDRVGLEALELERRAVPVAPANTRSRALVSCGAPMPGVSVRIVGSDGHELPDRCVGEVAVCGDFVLAGYHRQPEQSAASLRDGWFHTGDLGYVAEGELFVTGRKNDLIIVGGRNIQPEEIENLADEVPGLRPGRSVAFGVSDAAAGSERIVVVAELAAEADGGAQLAIARELRRRTVQGLNAVLGDVRLVEKGWIIKTSSGKHARPANREKYLQQFGDTPVRPDS
jgi:acyl-CoA synthetase (AMP-forming)/AMP-acid ligase II